MPYMIGVIVRRVSFSENVALIFYLSFKSQKKKRKRNTINYKRLMSIVHIFGAVCSMGMSRRKKRRKSRVEAQSFRRKEKTADLF